MNTYLSPPVLKPKDFTADTDKCHTQQLWRICCSSADFLQGLQPKWYFQFQIQTDGKGHGGEYPGLQAWELPAFHKPVVIRNQTGQEAYARAAAPTPFLILASQKGMQQGPMDALSPDTAIPTELQQSYELLQISHQDALMIVILFFSFPQFYHKATFCLTSLCCSADEALLNVIDCYW